MLNIYLLRHGETAWNADGNRYCGRTDLELTQKGKQQAKTVQAKLKDKHFNAIYASPLKRATHTAEIVSGNKEIITDERLIEVDFGEWEGKPRPQFTAENPTLWEDWISDPNSARAGGTGESGKEVVARLNDFFNDLIKASKGEEEDKNIMIVAHNGVNRLFLSHKLGMPLSNYRRFSLNNASILNFTLDTDGEIAVKI